MTIAVDLGRKATKQTKTNKLQKYNEILSNVHKIRCTFSTCEQAMPCLVKGVELFELQSTQTGHPLSTSDGKNV